MDSKNLLRRTSDAIIYLQPTAQQTGQIHQLASLSNRVLPNTSETTTAKTINPAFSFIESPDISAVQPMLGIADAGNLVDEKVSIYRHPLFPLLRMLFEKCEMATNSIESTNSVLTFDQEIKQFITQMAIDNKPFFSDDADVDGLVIKALQVFRIHLLELDKVNELCKDFCARYIACLREKLNSESVMETLDVTSTPPTSPSFTTTTTSSTFDPSMSERVSCSENSPLNTPSTPTNLVTNNFLSKKPKSGKRGVLPKHATHILKTWLFQHLVHPYPSEEEKRVLAEKTNLSNLQVNNWFINARRRILQPMLDSSHNILKNNKKAKQKNAAQKDWTNTIGVYNAYRTEALNYTPQMILNLSDQQVVMSQPIQLVTQVPVHELPEAYAATPTTTQPPVVLVAENKQTVPPPLPQTKTERE